MSNALFFGCVLMAVVPGVIAVGVLSYSLLLRRPRVWRKPPRDMLILAAHPDDCVIMAGEQGIEAIKAGKRVQIVYLTCGDDEPGTPKAGVRRAEAIEAWSRAGLSQEYLHFLDYPQSPLGGRQRLGADELKEAQGKLAEYIRAMPPDSIVFVPAQGEIHIDHTVVRDVALDALRKLGRDDLLVVETPEYNRYCSLLHTPVKSMRYVVASLPLVARVVRVEASSGPNAFVNGGPGFVLPRDDARLAKKVQMLKAFTSQNIDLLAGRFGYPDLGRMIDPAKGVARVGRYIKVGPRLLGASTIALWISIWMTVFILLLELANRAVRIAGLSSWATAACVGLAAGCLLLFLTRKKGIEGRLIYLLGGMGILLGIV